MNISTKTPFKKGSEHILFGMPTGRKPTPKFREALLDWRKNNPEKLKAISIASLPKDISGSKNGNWKGGKTARTRGIRFSNEYRVWRLGVLKRDGHKCRLCDETKNLHAHHLISVAECALLATLPMNGVTLCQKHHYENDKAWQGERPSGGKTRGREFLLMFTIPHKFQAYDTVGNWQYTKSGCLVIFVSELSDHKLVGLVGVHEFLEATLCKIRGITQKSVDRFDIKFEKNRKPDDFSEPGDSEKSPYKNEHFFATNVERLFAAECNVDWNKYETELNSL